MLVDVEYPAERIYEAFDKVFPLLQSIRNAINQNQLRFAESTFAETLSSIVAYRNSARGLLEVISKESQTTQIDAEKAIAMFKELSESQKNVLTN